MEEAQEVFKIRSALVTWSIPHYFGCSELVVDGWSDIGDGHGLRFVSGDDDSFDLFGQRVELRIVTRKAPDNNIRISPCHQLVNLDSEIIAREESCNLNLAPDHGSLHKEREEVDVCCI